MDTVVAMSGGVDSSVTALLLREQGAGAAGMFMKNWEEDDRFGACPAEADAADARRVAAALGIPLFTRNLAAEYWDLVFEHFLDEYRSGRTPNPDVLCNREIKFKTFLDHARDVGAERIATGHYARIDQRDGRYRLLRGIDEDKDQSYFLYTLGQDQLAVTLFPLGELKKSRVRAIAHREGLHVHAKKDSTGICFIGERDFKAFLSQYLPPRRGAIIDPDGREIGHHDGVHFYTLGQRQGLGIGGTRNGSGAAWYVAAKDLQTNTLTAVQGADHPALRCDAATCIEPSWTGGSEIKFPLHCTAKTRYRQPDQRCAVTSGDDGAVKVHFEQPQRAVTPGQSIVFYQDEVCLGGAVIDRTVSG